jgi:uncharacterized protein DUF5678
MTNRAERRSLHRDPSPGELGEYRGKWIAVIRGRIVASGDRAIEVLRAVDKDHPNDRPMVYRVPAGEVMLL